MTNQEPINIYADSFFQKVCQTCGESKLIYDFAYNNSSKDGHRKICKKCVNLQNRETRKKEKLLRESLNLPVVPVEVPLIKKCKVCGESKLIFDFPYNNSYKDHHLNKCKTCFTIQHNINYRQNPSKYCSKNEIFRKKAKVKRAKKGKYVYLGMKQESQIRKTCTECLRWMFIDPDQSQTTCIKCESEFKIIKRPYEGSKGIKLELIKKPT